jgi:hypothetical protein
MRDKFAQDSTEGILLVDAENAFNNLNRKTALANIKEICPPIYRYLHNTYQKPAQLIINDNGNVEIISSNEGCTQGDVTAMALYALGIKPLIDHLGNLVVKEDCAQCWFADDSSAAGKLTEIQKWWDELNTMGPKYGYFPLPLKTVLIVKEEHISTAQEVFQDTDVTISSTGDRHMGAWVGSEDHKERYVSDKVSEWVKDVEELARIGKDEPQAAYSCFTKAVSQRWTYVQRTIPDIGHLFEPLEDAIRSSLIPAIVGRKIKDVDRDIFALPVRFGGLNIVNPVESADREYRASRFITKNLTDVILNQDQDFSNYDKEDAKEKVKIGKNMKNEELKTRFTNLMEQLTEKEKRMIDLAKEKGVGAWLSARPIKSLGYVLNQQEFRDAICLRYGWAIPNTPTYCQCGKKNDLNHTLSCAKGGYTIMRHNCLRDLEAELLKEVCHDVRIEPELLPVGERDLTGNLADGARLDVSAVGVRGPHEKNFLDIKVFHPNCQSYIGKDIDKLYVEHERIKKRAYQERVLNVEHASFTPIVFSTTGGAGPEANRHHKRVASLIADKKKEEYSYVISYIRTRLCFSLLRSLLIAIRGARGKKVQADPISTLEFGLILSPDD